MKFNSTSRSEHRAVTELAGWAQSLCTPRRHQRELRLLHGNTDRRLSPPLLLSSAAYGIPWRLVVLPVRARRLTDARCGNGVPWPALPAARQGIKTDPHVHNTFTNITQLSTLSTLNCYMWTRVRFPPPHQAAKSASARRTLARHVERRAVSTWRLSCPSRASHVRPTCLSQSAVRCTPASDSLIVR